MIKKIIIGFLVLCGYNMPLGSQNSVQDYQPFGKGSSVVYPANNSRLTNNGFNLNQGPSLFAFGQGGQDGFGDSGATDNPGGYNDVPVENDLFLCIFLSVAYGVWKKTKRLAKNNI